jgi:hypothetical protein
VRFAAAGVMAVFVTLYTVLSVRMLREHRRNLSSDFSYTEGVSLSWLWWNIGFVLLKTLAILLAMSVEGIAVKMFPMAVFSIEPVITTIFVLRQRDLYAVPSPAEEDSAFDDEKNGDELTPDRHRRLKLRLLELLEKDEIFKSPELEQRQGQ